MHKSIAFFSPTRFSKKLGATKNRIEFGDALSKLGWITHYIGPQELELTGDKVSKEKYSESIKNFLIKNAEKFNVILYEYDSVPFDRNLFSSKTLFVARPALLKEHKKQVNIPVDPFIKLKSFITTNLLINKKSKLYEKAASKSLENCDLIQVQNSKDKLILEQKFPNKNIVIVPNGIGEDRFQKFQNINHNYFSLTTYPVIAFVGTFDFRKGAVDLKFIVDKIARDYPNVIFRFIGTKGLFQTKLDVINYFPTRNHKNIEVIPSFDPLDLPDLLSDCHLGVFPSYWESFGFGALEMMCAGLPVIAYNSAGPCDFIINDLLVDIGDKKKMASLILRLIGNEVLLTTYSKQSKEISKNYQWIRIAENAEKLYFDQSKFLP